MSEKYQHQYSNINRYIRYYTNIIRQIDIFLQEDQLKHTKLGFLLAPAPSYLPNMYELGHSDVGKVDDTASTKVKRVENEMVVIMQEHQEKEQQNIVYHIVPCQWPGSDSKIIKVNSYVRHNFI